jgi:hypothetical protein
MLKSIYCPPKLLKATLFFLNYWFIQYAALTKIKIEPIVDIYKLISNNEQNFELLELMA